MSLTVLGMAPDKGHSSKYPTLYVAMQKPNDEYYGGRKGAFLLCYLTNFTLFQMTYTLNYKKLPDKLI